jgi:putative membrane protein
MMLRVQNALKALLLAALALFLYGRITTGTLYFYISPRFAPFTLAAVLILLLLAASYIVSRDTKRRQDLSTGHGRWRADQHAHDDPHDTHDHNHLHEGQHEHHRLSWSGALIVLAPVVLGVLVVPQPLGAPALGNRALSPNVQGSAMPAAVRQAAEKSTLDYNLMDWYYLLSGAELSTELDGAEANVNGFVYQEPALAEDEFWLVRFTVSCCVADASAMSLLVHWPDAETLEDNQWVQVAGRIDATQLDNRNLPSLDAVKVELIPPPSQPYLYP